MYTQYLSGLSSEPLVLPVGTVSCCISTESGDQAYVKQGLDALRILGGL